MPTFPSISSASTANVDNGADSISLARADIKTNFDNVNSIISTYNGKVIVVTDESQSFSRQQYFNQATLTQSDSAGTFEWDLNTQQVAVMTLTGNAALNSPSNQQAGGSYILIVKQDGTGGHSLTFDGAYRWPNSVTPAVSTGINKADVFTFVSDGTYMYGSISRNY